ncbi:MAG: carbohydrate binding family 9 domain-containing protein [Gemmatimonadota bacterium]|nr:carbohydrate binding family 9 domain-containing protein [Gemmatimonadota bacterium]
MRALLLALFLLATAAAAQNAPPPAEGPSTHAAAPSVPAVRTADPIRIDGQLDEAAWATATPITKFTQVVPQEGQPATQRTEVRILYGPDALYIGARLYDTEPVISRLIRRDGSMTDSDWLTVILDSYHDHRSAFGFEINPSGVRRDQSRSETREDDSWDPVWEAATTVDAEGWTAEMRIPFSQLRFNPAQEQTWGLQLERSRARNREFSVWSFTPSTQPGGIPRFGHLEGLRELRTGKRLEVLPYSVLRAESVNRGNNPFRDDRDAGLSAGVDLKYRVTSDLTLDATVNPDFGQVEVDPAEVNLSAIETRFQEKRPFFVEGSEIFGFGSGGGNEVFYSRRIGRAPQLRAPSPLVEVADAAGILGAGKLSGRTAGGWSMGVLNATTAQERALFRDPEGLDHRITVEPLTNYFVGRLRRDTRAGQSVFGGMITAVNRHLDSDFLEANLRSAAYSGGVDFRHEWAQRTWTLTGFISGSHVMGDRRAITLTQLQPWRFFQRPDAEHLEVDTMATSLTGLSSQVQLDHRIGRHWRMGGLAGTVTPGYEVNDIGFQYRSDRIDGQAYAAYIENRPGKHLRSWQLNGAVRAERNYAGEPILNVVNLRSSLQGLGYWTAYTNVAYDFGSIDDRLTRGGPLAQRPNTLRLGGELNSDRRKPYVGSIFASLNRNNMGGRNSTAGLYLEAKPASNWNVSLAPVLSWVYSPAQYLTSVSDLRAENTFGRRYLFAELDQTTFSLETRLNYTFTPALSLQMYAQPFISSADFGAPAEFGGPRSYDFHVYGRDLGEVELTATGYRIFPEGREGAASPFGLSNRDFNLRSLRGNAVLRWEWRPGSTLFVAWQQNREDFAQYVGDFQFGRDRTALFRARPDNVLVLKVNYWLNP